jgi:hypothetical protein
MEIEHPCVPDGASLLMGNLGMRHVSQKENQMRWAHAEMLTLYQLQDGMRLHAGGEEEKSSKGVRADVYMLEWLELTSSAELNI